MYDAWAMYEPTTRYMPLGNTPKVVISDAVAREAARNESVSYAAYLLLYRRFFRTPARDLVRQYIWTLLMSLRYNPMLADPSVVDANSRQQKYIYLFHLSTDDMASITDVYFHVVAQWVED